MTGTDLLEALPSERGHFVLESGYHTDRWHNLDALFLTPSQLAPLVTALATQLAGYRPTGVCGPLQGGAFLAQAIATELKIRFYFTEPGNLGPPDKLFAATYRLPSGLRSLVMDQRLAVVDDVISAGSSLRATAATVVAAGATIAAAGTLVALGSVGLDHFEHAGVPVVALARQDFPMWPPGECPLCRAGTPLTDRRQADRAT